jgi:hypothetical protein
MWGRSIAESGEASPEKRIRCETLYKSGFAKLAQMLLYFGAR